MLGGWSGRSDVKDDPVIFGPFRPFIKKTINGLSVLHLPILGTLNASFWPKRHTVWLYQD